MNKRENSQGLGSFKALIFYGTANGGNLSADFNASEIVGRTVTIKRIAFIAYANGATTDLKMVQGANTYLGSIPDECRLNKNNDYYAGGLRPKIRINGTLLSIFPDSIGAFGYPLDLDIDNINYKHIEKLISINVSVEALYFNNVSAVTTANPKIKCLIEVNLS